MFRLRRFKITIIILLTAIELSFFIATRTGHAADIYEFEYSEFSEVDRPKEMNLFRKLVIDFEPGDQIKIAAGEEIFLDVKLKNFLGEGCFGRVFLIDEQPLARVVKFQCSDRFATQMMEKEYYSLNFLKQNDIPHSRILEYNPDFYLIKEYVPGETLTSITDFTWRKLMPDLQAILVIQLNELRRAFLSAMISVEDLHEDNIMFDYRAHTWKVVDASGIGGDLDDPLYDLETGISIHPELKTAYQWLVDFKDFEVCVEPYFFMKKVESLFREGHTLAASHLFSTGGPDHITELLDHCPSDFSTLWNSLSTQMAG
jgi:hypothetical protein